ncbi:MAG: hypothetical protein U9R57_06325 [Thermodesulfobacteriota bacterium]|nr:hypothetical protein [Thermodesulfobacteriota bacterium]
MNKFSKKQVGRVVIIPLVTGLFTGGLITYDRNRVIADYESAKILLLESDFDDIKVQSYCIG